jgi:hypothetical protein
MIMRFLPHRVSSILLLTTLIAMSMTQCIAAESSDADREKGFHAQWVDHAFCDVAKPIALGRSLQVIREGSPGDTKVNRCCAGGPIRLGDKAYPRGVGVNSYSILRITTDQPAARLVADIGLGYALLDLPRAVERDAGSAVARTSHSRRQEDADDTGIE